MGHHRLLIRAPAAIDVGDGKAPGIPALRVKADLVVALVEDLAMADQEAHGAAALAHQQLGWVKALNAAPEPVAPLERAGLQGVWDEAAACSREFAAARGRLIGDREEAAAGDVIHQPPPELAADVLQAALLLGVQQQAQAFDGAGAEHHQRGLGAEVLAAGAIDGFDAFGAAAGAIDQDMADDAVAAQLHPSCGQGDRQGAALGAGARPGGLGAAVQLKAAGVDQGQLQVPLDGAAQVLLRWRQGHRRLELPVGQLGQAVALALDRQKGFELGVPGGEVAVADRPIHPMAIPAGPLELVVGEPQGDASPGEAFAPHLSPPGPEEGAIAGGGVGVALLIDEQLRVGFPVAGVIRGDALPAAADVAEAFEAVERLAAKGPLGAELWARF